MDMCRFRDGFIFLPVFYFLLFSAGLNLAPAREMTPDTANASLVQHLKTQLSLPFYPCPQTSHAFLACAHVQKPFTQLAPEIDTALQQVTLSYGLFLQEDWHAVRDSHDVIDHYALRYDMHGGLISILFQNGHLTVRFEGQEMPISNKGHTISAAKAVQSCEARIRTAAKERVLFSGGQHAAFTPPVFQDGMWYYQANEWPGNRRVWDCTIRAADEGLQLLHNDQTLITMPALGSRTLPLDPTASSGPPPALPEGVLPELVLTDNPNFAGMYTLPMSWQGTPSSGHQYVFSQGTFPRMLHQDVCPAKHETAWYSISSASTPFHIRMTNTVTSLESPHDTGTFQASYVGRFAESPVYIAFCAYSARKGPYHQQHHLTVSGQGWVSCRVIHNNSGTRWPLAEASGLYKAQCDGEKGWEPDTQTHTIPQFQDPSHLFETLGSFTTSDNTFGILGQHPLHIRLSPTRYHQDAIAPAILSHDLNRVLFYGAARLFMHTDLPEVIISAVPMVYANPLAHTGTLMWSEGKTVLITREEMSAHFPVTLANKPLKVSNLLWQADTHTWRWHPAVSKASPHAIAEFIRAVSVPLPPP